VTINGKPVTSPMAGSDWNFPLYPFSAQSGKLVDFTIKTSLNLPGLRIVHELSGAQHRDVYLPGKGDWYDFWTGQRTTGSQTISVETPLDRIPLYVRAGSILPMGPEIQYVGEKPADPIELRVYRGADGAFTLYEDEGDSYNYEKGAFAQIPMTWNEASQTLTIGDRRGNFPGMLAKRKFQVVWVGSGHGGGEGPIDKPDATVTYEGKAVTVKAP
jgi:alpha-D-xyloside xylohydrolase